MDVRFSGVVPDKTAEQVLNPRDAADVGDGLRRGGCRDTSCSMSIAPLQPAARRGWKVVHPMTLQRPETCDDQFYRGSHYGKFLRQLLPQDAFRPQPTRLLFGLMHLTIVVAMGCVCVGTAVAWPLKVLAAVVAGHSWGILGFFAHEIWHGSVLGHGKLEHFLGHFFSLINASSGTGWKIWHNRTHHNNTQVATADPDAFPNMEQLRTDAVLRQVQAILPGYSLLGLLAPSFSWILKYRAATVTMFTNHSHGDPGDKLPRIVLETVLMTLPWVAVGVLFGWMGLFWLYVIPASVCSVVNMLYIHTNHHLSPHTPINDPLMNSLTVTSPRFIQWFHGNFGFHVEHHLFPSLSPRYARQLHELLKEHYPQRYQVMPWWKAVGLLFTTGTAYTNDGLRKVDLHTGSTFWTLRPGHTDLAQGPPLHLDVLPARPRDGSVFGPPVLVAVVAQ